MLSVERNLTELVALDVFDQYIFPHQQLQRDATRMHLAGLALEAGDPALANGTYVGRKGSPMRGVTSPARRTSPSWPVTNHPATAPDGRRARQGSPWAEQGRPPRREVVGVRPGSLTEEVIVAAQGVGRVTRSSSSIRCR